MSGSHLFSHSTHARTGGLAGQDRWMAELWSGEVPHRTPLVTPGGFGLLRGGPGGAWPGEDVVWAESLASSRWSCSTGTSVRISGL